MNTAEELIEELRNLRVRLAREIIELQTRREAYDEQKREVADLRKAIEEVLEEIETGTTGRPILDAARRAPARPDPAGDRDDDEDGPPTSGSFDREMTRAVEQAEARRAAERAQGPAVAEETPDGGAVGDDRADAAAVPAWGVKCSFVATLDVVGDEPAVIRIEHAGRDGFTRHLAFHGPVSETGFRSHFANPELAGPDIVSYGVAAARHLARLNGLDVREMHGAPAWRAEALGALGLSAADRRRLESANVRTLGDLADDRDLFGGAEILDKSVSTPMYQRALASLEAFVAMRSPPIRAEDPSRSEITVDDLAAIREQVEEVEGPAGDGSRTYICLRCRNGHGTELERCPTCWHGIRRLAAGLIEDLEGATRPKFVAPPTGGAWTHAALKEAAEQLGEEPVGMKVCNRCDVASRNALPECGGCRHNSFRRVYRKDGYLAVPPRPEPKAGAKKARKGVGA